MLLVTTALADNVKFDSGEHIFIGNSAKLYFPVKVGDNYEFKEIAGSEVDFRDLLNLHPDQQLSFGKIIAVPDLFSEPTTVIAEGKDLNERKQKFANCFAYFTSQSNKKLNAVFAIMDEEITLIQSAIDKGVDPSTLYATKDSYFNLRYFAADSDYVTLALHNLDHFGKDTWFAYQAGHAVAIDTALLAYHEADWNNKCVLAAKAYAEEAYAEHFLTDRFAAGHMRAPRSELAALKEPGGKAIGSILVMKMHNEDNKNGLFATNEAEQWWTYGDDRLLDVVDIDNKKIIDQTVQLSVDEITNAFRNGIATDPDNYAAQNFVPNIDKFYAYTSYVDDFTKTVPMFVYDNEHHNLLRRNNINQLHPKQLPVTYADMKPYGGWKGWWGATTLLELLLNYHPNENSNIDISKFTAEDGQLNGDGWKMLASLLNQFEQALFCADSTTLPIMRKYLHC